MIQNIASTPFPFAYFRLINYMTHSVIFHHIPPFPKYPQASHLWDLDRPCFNMDFRISGFLKIGSNIRFPSKYPMSCRISGMDDNEE